MPCVFHLLINQALMSKVKMINFRNLAPYVSLLLLKLKVQKQKDGEIMTHFLDGARKLFWIFHSIWKSPKMSDLVSLLNKVENENFWSDFQTLWLLLIISESLILLLMPFFLGNFPESLNSVVFLQVNCITLQCTSQIAGELRGWELQISGY